MRVLLTGATGLIGRALIKRLYLDGHEIVVLSRNPEHAREACVFPVQAYAWNATLEIPPLEAFAGVDAVVHLAGESIGEHRWTAEQKKKLYDSRILGTRNLIQAMQQVKLQSSTRTIHPSMPKTDSPVSTNVPSVFISASAVGIYGNQGDQILNEQSQAGTGFLADVCRDWEKEALAAQSLATQAAMRTVILRLGVVLAQEGGALEKLVPVFKSGLGGPLGNGKAWMSWIHIDDLIEVFYSSLTQSDFHGIYNAVAPEPETNQKFTTLIAQALNKKAWFKVPSMMLHLALGEMATVLLSSQRVQPKRLLETGFKFRFSKLKDALLDVCGDTGDDVLIQHQFLPLPPEKVFSFFSSAENLEYLTPEWLNFKVEKKSTPSIEEGTVIDYRLKLHGVPFSWQSKIESWKPNQVFVDRQIHGPYKKWVHTHTFQAVRGGTLMTDRVQYVLPAGKLGKSVAFFKVKKDIAEIFQFRRKKILEVFKLNSI
jgi:NAD dependent epimerase/dehydratase family enzyme/ligand-binding SRPBCC domain-containing protein